MGAAISLGRLKIVRRERSEFGQRSPNRFNRLGLGGGAKRQIEYPYLRSHRTQLDPEEQLNPDLE